MSDSDQTPSEPTPPSRKSSGARWKWGFLAAGVCLGLAVGGVYLVQRSGADREVMRAASALVEGSAGKVAADLATCGRGKSACACFEQVAGAALDTGLGQQVLEHLGGVKKHCGPASLVQGIEAEATVRAGRVQEGQLLALEARKANSSDPYAAYAMALGAFGSSTLEETQKAAEEALKLGRGVPAERLLSRVAFARGEFDAARAHLARVLQAFPRDTEALFTRGMLDVRTENYNGARSAFLKVLAIDPKHVEARKYLVLMTLSVGALLEARHHLEKLEQIDPTYPALGQLKEALAAKQAVTTP